MGTFTLGFAIFTLPFRGKSGNMKGQNAPIVTGGWVSVLSVSGVGARDGLFYLAGLRSFSSFAGMEDNLRR